MKQSKFLGIIIVCFLFSLIGVYFYYEKFHGNGLSNSQSDWGTFGDYIGGVIGSLFSFTGVILIYLTFEKQQETSVLQQFEPTFFELLNIHRELTKSIRGDFDGTGHEGCLFFEKFSEKLSTDFSFSFQSDSKHAIHEAICETYNNCFFEYRILLGPLYRNLYHFLKYTDESEISNLKKRKYIDIVQAQMSDEELYCLMCNAITYGMKKVVPLLDKYGFLENVETKSYLFDKYKKEFFPKTDFKYYSKNVTLGEIDQ